MYNCVNDFERRSNHIIHNFSMCDSFTLRNIFSSHCESFYGCELLNFSKVYMSDIYVSWRKVLRHIFRLSPRTHNYIVSILGNDLVVKLDRRLCKYVYKLIHCDNVLVKNVVKCKLYCAKSIIADNYRYLCVKYGIAHSDWNRNMNFVIKKICMEYSNHEYIIVDIIGDLIKIRDGVDHCDIINRDSVCALIEALCTD